MKFIERIRDGASIADPLSFWREISQRFPEIIPASVFCKYFTNIIFRKSNKKSTNNKLKSKVIDWRQQMKLCLLNLSSRQKVIVVSIDAGLFANTKNKAGTNHSIHNLENRKKNFFNQEIIQMINAPLNPASAEAEIEEEMKQRAEKYQKLVIFGTRKWFQRRREK